MTTAVIAPATSAAPSARALEGRPRDIRSATAPLSKRFISVPPPGQRRPRLEAELERRLVPERPLDEELLPRLEADRPPRFADVRPRALDAVRLRLLDARLLDARLLDARLLDARLLDARLLDARPRLPEEERPRACEDEPLRPLEDERPRPLADRTVLARRGPLDCRREEPPLLDELRRREELPFCCWGECELSVS